MYPAAEYEFSFRSAEWRTLVRSVIVGTVGAENILPLQ